MSLGLIDWTKVSHFLEVKKHPITCFRLIADKSITNKQNYKFFKDIAELEKNGGWKSLFYPVRDKGFKIVYKAPSDSVWYELVMKENSINFYVLCYEPNAEFVFMKLNQTFPKATIEQVNREETFIPKENTLIADLKLQRHNFFSLHTDYTEQMQPLEDILANSEDLKKDDVLKLSIRVQPFDQRYWSYKCEEWLKRTNKGKAPKRLRVNKNTIIGGLFALSELAYEKLNELFRELHSIAFKKQKTQQITINHATGETREIGEVSRRTHYKMTAPVFRTTIRIASHSQNEVRRLMNLKALGNSFIDLKDSNNSLVRTTIYEGDGRLFKMAHAEVSKQDITPLSTFDPDYNVLCDRELGKLFQMPTSSIQAKYKNKMEFIGRTETDIPEPFTDEKGIFIGTTELKGEKHKIFIPCRNVDEFVLPIIACGAMGSGKDTFAINYIVENALQGRGAVIPDVVDEVGRGMADAIISSLPPEKLIVLDFADEKRVPYLDWAEGMTSKNRFTQNRFASELVKFFQAEEEAGVQTERYLREAAKANPGGTVLQIGLMFASDQYRKQVIQECKKRGDIPTASFWEQYEKEGEGRKRQIAAPVLNRLHKLVGDPSLKPIFAQKSNGTIDFAKWLYEGKVIVCKIPKVAFGTTGVRTLIHWITVKTWLAKQAMMFDGRKCESFLVLNEPHQFLTAGLSETLKEVFTESRKFGLCVLTLFHDFAQIDKNLSDIMISAGANIVLLKQRGDKTWKKFMHRIEPTFTLEDCLQLNLYEAIIGFLIDRKDQPVLRVKMNNLPSKRGMKVYNNKNHIKKCMKMFARSIEEVEKEIWEDEMLLMNSQATGKKVM